MSTQSAPLPQNGRAAIGLILIGMLFISVNDMLIKALSDRFALHQIVFIRSLIGGAMALVFVRLEGGFHLLRTRRPGLHSFRVLCIVFANLTFFAALAVMPLATATALFFIAPLLITLLSIPVLGERVGPRRLSAVAIGFAGVLVMLAPEIAGAGLDGAGWSATLPILAALGYAGMQVMTRKLGGETRASAMSVYIHIGFLSISVLFFLNAGDGRYLDHVENESLIFLLRAWIWPDQSELWVFLLIGVLGGCIGYALSQAYRLGDAATVAPFEYVALPLAILWGWIVFDELPGLHVWAGTALIAGAGLYVFAREKARAADG